MHNAIHHDYRTCQVFPLRYDFLLHAQNEFFTLERANMFRIVRHKTESKNVSRCRELHWKIERQTDRHACS